MSQNSYYQTNTSTLAEYFAGVRLGLSPNRYVTLGWDYDNPNPTQRNLIRITAKIHNGFSVARAVPPFHRILWKSVQQFLRNPANKQTN